ncbi:hypothetical protein BDR04DRAFT_1141394 [Suillus decipiens]|nr:hypothetical protein BDR04DRAFT_1141394 [Suillus decipiens]
MTWILNAVWEVLALILSVWIAVKQFRGLRRLRPSTGSIIIGNCFRVLIQSHVLYFARLSLYYECGFLFCSSSAHASFAGVSCTQLIVYSPELVNSNSIGALMLSCALYISLAMQTFVLGPRLILSVRKYHAELVVNSNAETSIDSIVFQEHVYVPTSSTV